MKNLQNILARPVTPKQIDKYILIIPAIFLVLMWLRPTLANSSVSRSESYIDSGKFKQAVPSLRQALMLYPNDAETHATLGYVYKQLNDIDKAILESKKAVDLKPKNTSYRHYLGVLYVQNQNYKLAIEQFTTEGRLCPSDFASYRALVNAYSKLGEKDKALAAIAKMKTVFKKDPKKMSEIKRIEQRITRP